MTTDPPAIYLCTVHDLAGQGESVERQTSLLARILQKLGYLWALASGTVPKFDELWAVPPEAAGLSDNEGTPEAGT